MARLLEAIGFAHAVKIEALAQLGAMLKKIEKQAGGRGLRSGGTRGSKKELQVNAPPTLADLGLDVEKEFAKEAAERQKAKEANRSDSGKFRQGAVNGTLAGEQVNRRAVDPVVIALEGK